MFDPIRIAPVLGALAAGLIGLASPAAAAGNTADVCAAPAPAPGATVHGPVLFVETGDTLCVALGETPDQWVRLSLADAPADNPIRRASTTRANDNPRGALLAVAFSQNVDCNVQADGRAICALQDGRSIGAALRQPTAWAAGKEWR
ncbi:MAG: hypothetical protein GC145_04705 [Caulobacter sp.]|nr:hypothetical protein [Caulobacter sp.]